MVSLTDILAFSGLTLGLVSSIFTAFLLGNLITSLEAIKDAKTALADKVKEFGDITAKASEANNSMGLMLADLGERVQVIDERVSMLGGTQTTGGVPKWPNSTKTSL